MALASSGLLDEGLSCGVALCSMIRFLYACSVICAIAVPGICCAQSTPLVPQPHHHHDDAPAPGEKLGQVSFPTSCAAKSQAAMERGIALLHSFGYTNAQMQFEAIAKDDPACAMAHWGIAMTQFQELWQQPDDASLKRGAEEMAKARPLAAKAT